MAKHPTMTAMSGDLRQQAVQAAQIGAAAARYYFARPGLTVTTKADASPVTAADQACETAIRAFLAQERPDDAVMGEEDGLQGDPAARWRWVVDPIDGTRNFIRGIPLWSTLVAVQDLHQAGAPVVASCVGLPMLDQWYSAAVGAGATCNEVPIAVSGVAELAQALWCYESRSWFTKHQLGPLFDWLDHGTALQRGVCDAFGHMLVASGFAEVIVEPELSLWDKAAPSLVVREAGGRFTDLHGAESLDGAGAVVSNGLLHDQVLEQIACGR